jgi:hypothetical protein
MSKKKSTPTPRPLPLKYTHEEIVALIAKNQRYFADTAMNSMLWFFQEMEELTPPEDALDEAAGLAEASYDAAEGHTTFTREEEFLEYLAVNSGMALALLTIAASYEQAPPPAGPGDTNFPPASAAN